MVLKPPNETNQAELKSTVQTTRLHGLPDKPLSSLVNKDASKYYFGSSLCADLYDVLTSGQPEGDLAQR
jgi:hypothetical protein